jgi:50S ribosomal subunit-associated GTPase HflX
LCALIGSLLLPESKRVRLTIPFGAWETIDRIMKQGTIHTATYVETGVVIEADINRALARELKPYIQ